MTKITKQEWVRLQALLEPKLYEQLRKYAFENRISYCETTRRALKRFLAENNA